MTFPHPQRAAFPRADNRRITGKRHQRRRTVSPLHAKGNKHCTPPQRPHPGGRRLLLLQYRNLIHRSVSVRWAPPRWSSPRAAFSPPASRGTVSRLSPFSARAAGFGLQPPNHYCRGPAPDLVNLFPLGFLESHSYPALETVAGRHFGAPWRLGWAAPRTPPTPSRDQHPATRSGQLLDEALCRGSASLCRESASVPSSSAWGAPAFPSALPTRAEVR